MTARTVGLYRYLDARYGIAAKRLIDLERVAGKGAQSYSNGAASIQLAGKAVALVLGTSSAGGAGWLIQCSSSSTRSAPNCSSLVKSSTLLRGLNLRPAQPIAVLPCGTTRKQVIVIPHPGGVIAVTRGASGSWSPNLVSVPGIGAAPVVELASGKFQNGSNQQVAVLASNGQVSIAATDASCGLTFSVPRATGARSIASIAPAANASTDALMGIVGTDVQRIGVG